MAYANSIEYLAEVFVMQSFAAASALSGVTIRHHDDDNAEGTNTIAVSADQGERMLEAFRGYNVTVTAEYRSDTNNAATNDAIAKAMRAAIEGAATANLACYSDIQDLLVYNEQISGGREAGENLRTRTLTIPLQILPK